MKHRTVDASVGLKWFVPESHTEQAERLLDGSYELLVPDLFYVEVANILWKHVRGGRMEPEQAGKILEKMLSFPLRAFRASSLVLPALDIAVSADRTAYDSLYVALAMRENAPLVTADERLYNALSSGPLAAHVEWVGNRTE